MRAFPVSVGIAALITLVLPGNVAFGQVPGVTTAVEKRFEAANAPAQAEAVQYVLDFAPEAWTPQHTHSAPGYVTVLQGEVTLRMGGTDQKFKTGEGWVDQANMVHAAGNETGAPARLVATFLVPKGATVTTVVATGAQTTAPPGPATVSQLRMDLPAPPAQFDVVHRLTEVAAGATVPMHTHPGPNFAAALEGSASINMEGMIHNYNAGDTWVEPKDVVHGGTNPGSTMFRVVTSGVVPRGAPLAIPAQQPAAAPAVAPAPAPAPAPAAAAPARPAAGPPAQVPAVLPRTGELPLPVAPAALVGFGLMASILLTRRLRS